MKKILAIMGSPRKNKNTDAMLDFLLDGVDKEIFSIDKVNLRDQNIGYCTGCDYCGSTGKCVLKDDMQNLYQKIDESDVVVLAAPLYFNSVNGLTKNMIDRSQKYWSLKYSLGQSYKRGENRIGIFLATGGAPYSHQQFDGALPVMDFFFKAINVDYKGNFFVSETDEKPLKHREDIRKKLYEIGANLQDTGKFYEHF